MFVVANAGHEFELRRSDMSATKIFVRATCRSYGAGGRVIAEFYRHGALSGLTIQKTVTRAILSQSLRSCGEPV